MSAEQNTVLILTINDCPGMRVARVIGPVYGTGVRSRNFVGNFMDGIAGNCYRRIGQLHQ